MQPKRDGQRWKNMKTLPIGNEILFKKEEWVSSEELDNEEKVLNHPIMQEAFDRMLPLHKPVQHTAFLSLCALLRPYSKGQKWQRYIQEFDGKVDMIVSSNGGVIPRDFWESWPYMNYESGPPHYERESKLFKKLGTDWLLRFFKTHSYKYVICNIRHVHRIYSMWPDTLEELKQDGYIEDYFMVPSKELYEKAANYGFGTKPYGMGAMNPDLHKFILDETLRLIEMCGYDKSKMPKTIFDLVE